MVGLAAVFAIGAAGCAAGTTAAGGPHIGASATVTIGATDGGTLPANLLGLSLEASSLASHHDEFANTDLAGYLRTLGRSGLLRIGGNSSDRMWWTSTGEPLPTGFEAAITPDSLRALAKAIAGTGWQVVLGVNLKARDAARAADEARYASQILGRQLRAIELGNEPNYYYPKRSVVHGKVEYGTYYADLAAYASAIRQAVPGIALAGPDAGHNHPQFVADFAAQHFGVGLLTDHEYPLGACGGNVTTIPELLSDSSRTAEVAAAQSAASAGTADGVPAVMDETNSVTCGGTTGVSNVFAAALWSLDYTLLLAEHGVVGADFHGGISGCGPYTPLCTASGGSALTAQPVFYGMLALDQVGTGQFHTATSSDPSELRSYAVSGTGQLTVVLDEVGGSQSTSVTITLPRSYAHGRQTVLATSSSAGLAATGGITLGGQQVGQHGVLPAPKYTPVPVHGSSATVTVAPGTAVIIKFS